MLYFCHFKKYYVYSVMPMCMPTGLKRASALMSGREPPCECWEESNQCS